MDRQPIPKVYKEKKPPKYMKQIGRRTLEYNKWRDTVAIPYLDATSGHKCSWCPRTDRLEVDHIKTRGAHPELKFDLDNIRYLCGGLGGCHGKRL